MTITPYPQTLVKIEKYFRENDFNYVSNLQDKEDVNTTLEELDSNLDEINLFSNKLERLKLKI